MLRISGMTLPMLRISGMTLPMLRISGMTFLCGDDLPSQICLRSGCLFCDRFTLTV